MLICLQKSNIKKWLNRYAWSIALRLFRKETFSPATFAHIISNANHHLTVAIPILVKN
ncbi:hypothetical protein HMPREF0208_05068 [Citrobacter koseri]|nr:hypothetical protein HMPREF3220_04455 [Citrobacter koseri]KXA01844.1 hypothetical protein HMPREF3207_02636 [Citrobacter koseri]KXB38696.1 hypothetical protein HMPREF0208_05068 [Citrobacter koseri]